VSNVTPSVSKHNSSASANISDQLINLTTIAYLLYFIFFLFLSFLLNFIGGSMPKIKFFDPAKNLLSGQM